MGSRLAGKLLTGPLAFLVAGLIDFGVFAGATFSRAVFSVTHRMLNALSNIAPR